MAEQKSDVDDWLDDLEDESSSKSEDLSQDDINKILGGGDAATPSSEWGSSPAVVGGELDDEELNRLLGASEPVADAAGGVVEQADIEALLGKDSKAVSAGDFDRGLGAELNDADIDSLLSGDGMPTRLAGPLPEEDDDIAKLFAEAGGFGQEGEKTLAAKAVDFAEILADDETAQAPAAALEDYFATPPPPERKTAIAEDETLLDDNLDALLAESSPEPVQAAAAVTTAASGKKQPPGALGKPKKPLNRRKLFVSIMAAFLAALIAGGSYWFFLGSGKKVLESLRKSPPPPTAVAVEEPHPQATPQPKESLPTTPPKPNTPPVVLGENYQVPQTGGELTIRLAGRDDDGDALSYEVTTQPRFGRLSGTPPNLVYLQSTNFPGEDHFEYRATDGKDTSAPGTIKITGTPVAPPPAPVAEVKPPEQKPKPKVTKPVHVQEKRPEQVVPKIPPTMHIAEVPESRRVGERVVIDASGSSDDERSSLDFTWEQIGGAPVQLTALNKEGSVVAFVMPAAFSVETEPAITLRLTLIDTTGLRTARNIRVATESRRSTGSALWGRAR